MWGPCPVASEVVVIMPANSAPPTLANPCANPVDLLSGASATELEALEPGIACAVPAIDVAGRLELLGRPRALARSCQGPAPLLQGIRLIGHQLEASKRLQR